MLDTRDLVLQFFSQYDIQPNGCWRWTGSLRRDGYGRVTVGDRHREMVHRFAYRLFNGEIPHGLTVDHTCHNADLSCPGGPCLHRRCVNPDHLEAVAIGVNVLRGRSVTASYARRKSCMQGHAYTEENTHIDRAGRRHCRTCNRVKAGQLRDRLRTAPNPGPNALKAHCRKGHPYDEANTYVNARGHRYCRACARIKEQRRRDAIKAARSDR
jgi:HNH endonuclease